MSIIDDYVNDGAIHIFQTRQDLTTFENLGRWTDDATLSALGVQDGRSPLVADGNSPLVLDNGMSLTVPMVMSDSSTIEFWISPPAADGAILAVDDSMLTRVNGRLTFNGEELTQPDELMHIVIVIQDGQGILSVNEEQSAPVAVGSADELVFTGTGYSIDAIAIYATALTEEVLSDHYESGLAVPDFEDVVRSIYPGLDIIIPPETEVTEEDNEAGESHYTWLGVDGDRDIEFEAEFITPEDFSNAQYDSVEISDGLRPVPSDGYLDASNTITDPWLQSPTVFGGSTESVDHGVTITASENKLPGTMGLSLPDQPLSGLSSVVRSLDVFSESVEVRLRMRLYNGSTQVGEEIIATSVPGDRSRLIVSAETSGATVARIDVSNNDDIVSSESFTVQRVSSQAEYFDGNTEDDEFVYQWEGAEGASVSLRISPPRAGGGWQADEYTVDPVPGTWIAFIRPFEAVATKLEWVGNATVEVRGTGDWLPVENHSIAPAVSVDDGFDVRVSLDGDGWLDSLRAVGYANFDVTTPYGYDSLTTSSGVSTCSDVNTPIEKSSIAGFRVPSSELLTIPPAEAEANAIAMWVKIDGDTTLITRGTSISVTDEVLSESAWVNGIDTTALPYGVWNFIVLTLPGVTTDPVVISPNGRASIITTMDIIPTEEQVQTMYRSFFGFEKLPLTTEAIDISEGAHTELQSDWGVVSSD